MCDRYGKRINYSFTKDSKYLFLQRKVFVGERCILNVIYTIVRASLFTLVM
jgi:hypothetical protein